MNNKGALSDLFIFMILAFAILFICGIFIFIGGRATSEVHAKLDGTNYAGNENVTQIINQTFDKVNQAYQSLYWISIMLIVGMIISIFIGSYLVTTKPVFFIPYALITIIAIIVAVVMSNAYEQVIQTPLIAGSFTGFTGGNFIMANLPIWIAVIGIVGAIIMFVRMGSRENVGGTIYG